MISFKPLRFKIIIFDLDGTLVDIRPDCAIKKYLEFTSKYGLDKEAIIYSYQQALNEWKNIKESLYGRKKYLELWKICFKNLGLHYNLSVLADDLQKEIEQKCEDSLYEDAILLLRELRTKNFMLGILSERPKEAIKASLKRHNIFHLFDFCISAYDLDKSLMKLSDVVWKAVINITCSASQQICYIGDDYETDIIPALKHGIFAILLDRWGKYADRKCIKIKNLNQTWAIIS